MRIVRDIVRAAGIQGKYWRGIGLARVHDKLGTQDALMIQSDDSASL